MAEHINPIFESFLTRYETSYGEVMDQLQFDPRLDETLSIMRKAAEAAYVPDTLPWGAVVDGLVMRVETRYEGVPMSSTSAAMPIIMGRDKIASTRYILKCYTLNGPYCVAIPVDSLGFLDPLFIQLLPEFEGGTGFEIDKTPMVGDVVKLRYHDGSYTTGEYLERTEINILDIMQPGNLADRPAAARRWEEQITKSWPTLVDIFNNNTPCTIGGDEAGPTPNANKLRRVLNRLGSAFTEKKQELSGGGDLTSGIVRATTSVLEHIDELNFSGPFSIQLTGGNDVFHQCLDYNSRHKVGNAIDFVIDPSTDENLDRVASILMAHTAGNSKFRFIDEYRRPTGAATAGHFHMSWALGTEGSKTQALAQKMVSEGTLSAIQV